MNQRRSPACLLPPMPATAPTLGQQQRGFTIIEALIALLILTFGLLSVSGMQLTLSGSGDVSKQRSEALRLAQEKIEYLRSYSQINSATSTLAYASLSSGSDTTTTNALYTRSWTISGSATATHKPITLEVSWTDRTGAVQSLTVSSVISKADPNDTGLIAFPYPANATLRRYGNRSLDVAATRDVLLLVGSNTGKSVYNFSPSLSLIFDNYNGNVVQTCNTHISSSSVDLTLSGCTTATGVILAGFIRYRTCNSSTCTSGNYVDGTHTGVTLTGITGAYPNSSAVQCTTTLSKNTYNNNAVSIGGSVTGGLSSYLCLIPLENNTTATWSGNVAIKGVSKTADFVVCRYQYSTSSLAANVRNVQPYSSVGQSLDNQNYYIGSSTITLTNSTSAACPSIAQSDPTLSASAAAAQSMSSTLTLHQNCRSTVDTLSTRATSLSSTDTPPTTYCP